MSFFYFQYEAVGEYIPIPQNGFDVSVLSHPKKQSVVSPIRSKKTAQKSKTKDVSSSNLRRPKDTSIA